jgi:hypothetical protein
MEPSRRSPRTSRRHDRIGRCRARDAIFHDRICIVRSSVLLSIDFAEELVGAKERMTTSRAFGRRVLVQPPAIRSDTTADADIDVALAIDVIASEMNIESARVTHFSPV